MYKQQETVTYSYSETDFHLQNQFHYLTNESCLLICVMSFNVYLLTLLYWMSNVFVTVKKHIQCRDYFGNHPQVYSVTGKPLGLAVENDVAYYSQEKPSR